MAYVISEINLERQTLLGKVLARVTDRLLTVLQLPPGTRGLDLGCGMGETTRQDESKRFKAMLSLIGRSDGEGCD